MEENKYYTPSIEEFCVGFEFENYYEEGKLMKHPSNTNGWKSEIFDWSWADIIYDMFEHDPEEIVNNYRVKLLDSQDIESLGLMPIPNFPERTKDIHALTFTNPAKSFILEYYPNIETIREVMRTKLMIRAAENYLLFSGFCRNKSELIRILKMLRKYE